MSGSVNDNGSTGSSPLTDLDGSSPPTPGPAQTPGRADSPVDQVQEDLTHASAPQETLGRQKRGEGPQRSRRSSTKAVESEAPLSSAKPTKKKSARGWAYVTEEEYVRQEQEKLAAEQITYDDGNDLGRRTRRRSSIVPQRRATRSQSPQKDEVEATGAAPPKKVEKPSSVPRIKLVKKKRNASNSSLTSKEGKTDEVVPSPATAKGSNGVGAGIEPASQAKVSQRRALVSDDDDDDDDDDEGPSQSSGRRIKDKKRPATASKTESLRPAAKKLRRAKVDEDDIFGEDEALSDEEDEPFSGPATSSDEEDDGSNGLAVRKRAADKAKAKKSLDLTRSSGKNGKHESKRPADVARPIAKTSSPMPIVSTPQSPANTSAASLKTTSSASQPQPQPRPVVRKIQKPSLLNKLMGPGIASGSNSPMRNAQPRPRPPNAGKAAGEQGRDVQGARSAAGAVNGSVSSSTSSMHRSGANEDVAMEMHALRERERHEHEHPKGLFDLLEDAEIMMEFEEETRQELRYDPFLHKHKLYKPGRTEGVWKLVEHIKKRHSGAPQDESQSQSQSQTTAAGSTVD